MCCPALTVGESYRIIIGDSEEEIALTEVSASCWDASGAMFTGPMNRGGMQPMERGAEGTPPQAGFGGPSQGPARAGESVSETAESPANSAEAWLLVGISALILIAGLILALCYRRSLHIET